MFSCGRGAQLNPGGEIIVSRDKSTNPFARGTSEAASCRRVVDVSKPEAGGGQGG